MATHKKLALIILDGWGYGDRSKSDAVFQAHTPFFDSLIKTYPNSKLLTSGENVGLPEGQMGNSEVGHLNIGAGRIVFQDLVKINIAIREKTLDENPSLIAAFNYAKEKNCAVHLMGLVSDGGVHSSQDHLHYLCNLTQRAGLENVFVHAFTDGRDTDPKSGLGFLKKLENHLMEIALPVTPLSVAEISDEKWDGVQLVSVIGRYYAMDRDKRWDRIRIAYDQLLAGEGRKTQDLLKAVEDSYKENVTDEFIKPIVKVDEHGRPIGRIKEGDVVICFNFRTDRCREITEALTQKDHSEQGMHTLNLHYVTMTSYDNTFKNVNVLFEKDNLANTIGEILSVNGRSQVRIAETEKYAHVTFFFSGGREEAFNGEKRILIQSPKVATYDLKPEMSATEVTGEVIKEMQGGSGSPDFICLNFANSDMVGHTGVYAAIMKAVETVDACVKKIVEAGIINGYSFLITADHGNADYAINPDGSPNTAHSLNPVPCIVIDKDVTTVKDGILADIAPTILKIIDLPKPAEMTGNELFN